MNDAEVLCATDRLFLGCFLKRLADTSEQWRDIVIESFDDTSSLLDLGARMTPRITTPELLSSLQDLRSLAGLGEEQIGLA